MNVLGSPRPLPILLSGVVVSVVTGVVAWHAADALRLAPTPSPAPDVAVPLHVPRTVPAGAPQGPTPEQVAEAQRWWRDDVTAQQGADTVTVHCDYDPDVDLYRIQRVIITWTRQQKDGTVTAVGSLAEDHGSYEFHTFDERAFGDRNHDGVRDVLVRRATGGNCSTCERPALLQPKDGKLVDLLDVPWLQQDYRWPHELRDVDQDGRDELVLRDVSHALAWENDGSAVSPAVEYVAELTRRGPVPAPASPHIARQRREALADYRSARSAHDDTGVIDAVIRLAMLETAGAPHDFEAALARVRQRLADAHVGDAHRFDVQSLESRLRRVTAELVVPD